MRIKRGSSYILVFTQIFILLFAIIAFSSFISAQDKGSRSPVGVKLTRADKKAITKAGEETGERIDDAGVKSNIEDLKKIAKDKEKKASDLAIKAEDPNASPGVKEEARVARVGAIKAAEDLKRAEREAGPGVKDAVGATGMLTKLFVDSPNSAMLGIAQGAAWGGIVYGVIALIGPMVTDDEALISSLSMSLGAGVFAGRTVTNLLAKRAAENVAKQTFLGMTPGVAGLVAGGIVTVAIFLATYKKTSTEIIQFSCQPWEAPIGGKKCEQCNKQEGGLPCSEYQCRSLGQACQLINPGTEEELCASLHRGDVKPPVITEWDLALMTDYSYEPGTFISPGDRGARIVYDKSNNGCIPAYTPLSFGINADEPARCRLDYTRKRTFAEMQFDFGGSNLYRYNHSQALSLPGLNAAEEDDEGRAPILENDGEFELFIRCMDANGNGDPANRAGSDATGSATPFTEGVENTASFVFQFCVDKGPDTTPPRIFTTDIINGMPIAYNTTSTDLNLYINEPSSCRWSRSDLVYEKMEEDMVCNSNVIEMNARMLYECQTTLSGLKDRQENKFYFRCEDQPHMPVNDRARNQESHEFSLMGSQPLILNKVGPNGTLRDSTDVVQVTLTAETSAGYEEGKATCYYSDTDEIDSYIRFLTTFKADGKHEQDLHLAAGEYAYYIKCIDLGGNEDKELTRFTVESDRTTPLITRAYKQETYLRLSTSEDAECVYGTNDCNYLFDDGVKMTVVDDREHFTDWDTRTNFYIKCQDEWGNQPVPNECSMILRAMEDYNN